jgi:4-amino-4-deoxy-L-arabinose transferase-like glycosyltransferase
LQIWTKARRNLSGFALIFSALFLAHAPLLRLSYFWDEAGYFIPAARDLLLTGSLIPHSTLSNAHPPLLMLWLAFWWKFSAFTPAVTRFAMLLVASFTLLGVWRLARRVSNPLVAGATVICTALYPVFFTASSLVQLDMMAAAFTIWGLAMYLERRTTAAVVFFALAPLAKETALIAPLALCGWELLCPHLRIPKLEGEPLCIRSVKSARALIWLLCAVPIACWLAYHHHVTGYVFGNPEYLRYNATATLNPLRIVLAMLIRLWHLLGYLNLFALTLGAAYAMTRAARRNPDGTTRRRIPINAQLVFAVVILAYLVAFSIVGGAMLARYLLPVYPLVILLCVSTLRRRVRRWISWVAVACGLFVFALLVPPPYRVSPEDTLLYRDYVLVHKAAANQLAARFSNKRILTAWPASDELTRPYLGYVKQPLNVLRLDNFSDFEMLRAARATDQFDVLFLFSTKWEPQHPLLTSLPFARKLQERFFDYHEDMDPHRAAALLGGRVVDYQNRNNEWIAILVIERIENASSPQPEPGTSQTLAPRSN